MRLLVLRLTGYGGYNPAILAVRTQEHERPGYCAGAVFATGCQMVVSFAFDNDSLIQ
ncbi:MAG: hypothetical protein LAP13_09750 [Acidobacteriia bacterium]|nr:hypothetical protein [Terriglobia bacterium]